MKAPSLQTKIGDIVRECYPGGSMSPACWHVFAFNGDTGEAYVGAAGAPAANWFKLRSWVRENSRLSRRIQLAENLQDYQRTRDWV